MGAFLDALQAQGWVERDRNPRQSRFWALIDGPTAAMFGVFSPYEKNCGTTGSPVAGKAPMSAR